MLMENRDTNISIVWIYWSGIMVLDWQGDWKDMNWCKQQINPQCIAKKKGEQFYQKTEEGLNIGLQQQIITYSGLI